MDALRRDGIEAGAIADARATEGPPVSRESLCLRLGGMTLIIVSLGVAAYFQDALDPQQIVRDRSKWIAPLTLLVIVNAVALGFVLLLAGLRQLSLVSSAQARRGALARMVAVNLFVFGYVLMTFTAEGFGSLPASDWHLLLALIVFVLFAPASFKLFRSGWKHEARTAEEALVSDPRAPVVYLRSFGIDDQVVSTSHGLGAHLAGLLTYTASISPEQEMAFIMERVGPVVAIGKPGERLPELGAARLYVGDDQWRAVVGGLLNRAALVVIRAGETPNLWWEIAEAKSRCPAERVIILALGPPSALPSFDRRLAETFGTPVASGPTQESQLIRTARRLLLPYGRSSGKIIYFDRQSVPYEQPLWNRLTWSGLLLSPYRPYRDSLQGAFRIVFTKLALPYPPKRTLTTAVMLALLGGIVGLHHFYMGNRRRGMWHAAFFWLMIPMIVGWIDAVRLALLSDAQFQARLATRT